MNYKRAVLTAMFVGIAIVGSATAQNQAITPAVTSLLLLDSDVADTDETFDSHRFTTAGATGRFGPTQAQVNDAYEGSQVDSRVRVLTQGYQRVQFSVSGVFRIEAVGAAAGFESVGGRGASMAGDFQLDKGDALVIVVGQKGGNAPFTAGGGGGGSFVEKNGSDLLIAAGGGGSSGACTGSNGGDAKLLTAAADGTVGLCGSPRAPCGVAGAGGVNGNGGNKAESDFSFVPGPGGGGYLSDGEDARSTRHLGGNSFKSDSIGGVGLSRDRGLGGFGGGAGAGNHGGGGGGGYSGGGGGTSNCPAGVGGGGGSFNAGQNQENVEAVGLGDGWVTITKLQ